MAGLPRPLSFAVASLFLIEDIDHVLNWHDARDRVFGELIAERDRAEQFSVNIDGASAHPLKDSGVIEFVAEQPRHYGVLLRIREPLQYAENLDFELFRLGAGKDRVPDRAHSGFDLVDGEKFGL